MDLDIPPLPLGKELHIEIGQGPRLVPEPWKRLQKIEEQFVLNLGVCILL
jgi:hypothetical protein